MIRTIPSGLNMFKPCHLGLILVLLFPEPSSTFRGLVKVNPVVHFTMLMLHVLSHQIIPSIQPSHINPHHINIQHESNIVQHEAVDAANPPLVNPFC